MFETIITQLNAMRAADAGALGAVLAILIEGLLFAHDGYNTFCDDYDALKKRVKALEDKISKPPVALSLSPFQKAIRTQITAANFAANANLGTNGTVTLTTSGGTGEISTIRRFLMILGAGSASTAAGAQARFTPPVTLKGPIAVRLLPSTGSTGGSIFDNDPYFTVNYASDGVTVNSIDIGVNAALTASTNYGLQVEICEVDTSSNAAALPVVLSN
jgi:hypothetical protein